MRQYTRKRTRKLNEEKVLRVISTAPVQITEDEYQHESDTITSRDYDRFFLQAMRERKEECIKAGYGSIKHPTTRIFEIGIDSIRAGKPSRQFLRLLAKIGEMAENKDVMAALFPNAFPRRIKTSTVRAAQRDAKLVADFKAHLRRYLAGPRTAEVQGSEDKGGTWSWVEPTYAEAMEKYKRGMPPDKQKSLDRALLSQGLDVLEWRDWLAEIKKSDTIA